VASTGVQSPASKVLGVQYHQDFLSKKLTRLSPTSVMGVLQWLRADNVRKQLRAEIKITDDIGDFGRVQILP
jgi:hypothetical protein